MDDIGRQHSHEAEPFAQQDLPASHRFGGDGVNGSRNDLAGDGIDRSENGHDHREQIDGVQADHEHAAQNLVTQELGHVVGGEIGHLQMQSRR